MTVSLFLQLEVKDFNTWKDQFDQSAQFIKERGVLSATVHRNFDNHNKIMIAHQFENETALEAFVSLLDSDLFREDAAKKSGVILKTMEMWAGENV